MSTKPSTYRSDPPSLVAILIAAHRTRNYELERSARRELKQTHGIKISFAREIQKAATNG